MKKKLLVIILILLICVCCMGCDKTNEDKGTDIFGDKLDSINEIIYYYPDETTCVIDNPEQIKVICDILKNETYTEVEEKTGIEGGFFFDFVGDETLEIGLVQRYLRYEGAEYAALDENAFAEIYDMINELKGE